MNDRTAPWGLTDFTGFTVAELDPITGETAKWLRQRLLSVTLGDLRPLIEAMRYMEITVRTGVTRILLARLGGHQSLTGDGSAYPTKPSEFLKRLCIELEIDPTWLGYDAPVRSANQRSRVS